MSVKLYDKQFKAYIRNATSEGLQRAGIAYHTDCRQAVNKSNPRNRETGANDQPSKPGEPPRARTGFGRDNIVFEYNDNRDNPAVRVGVSKAGIYMYWLELGRMARTITAKFAQFLKIPWTGPVFSIQAKTKTGKLRFRKDGTPIVKAKSFGQTKSGLQRFMALGKNGQFEVLKDSSGGYFYFRRSVRAGAIAARPWLVSTLFKNREKYARLATLGRKRTA